MLSNKLMAEPSDMKVSSNSGHILPVSHRSEIVRAIPMTRVIMEAAWEIIRFNTIISVVFLIIVCFKHIHSIGMRGSDIIPSNRGSIRINRI